MVKTNVAVNNREKPELLDRSRRIGVSRG